MINNRVGLNSTFNLARPAGKVFAGFVVLILLSIPFMGFMLDGVDSKPLGLEVDDAVITASYGRSSYEVGIEEMEEIRLFDELPEGLVRIGGVGAEHLLKGRFRSQEFGNITLCLDPHSPPFVMIRTKDGRQFLFGTRDAAVTETVFACLQTEDR